MPHTTTDRLTRKFIGAVEDEWQLYSDNLHDYSIGSPIGFGASSIVYTAQFKPQNADGPLPCALKVLDLDRLPPHSLRLLQRETQLMSLSKHPNVLRVRGTWMDGHKLYIALRLMNAGSAADVMKYGWAGGMQEEVVKCILKQALEGINYLHINGFIHRDIKAANFLIDDDGTVLLGDLGVAAFLWESEDTPSPSTSPPNKRITISSTFPSPRHPSSHHPHKPRTLGKRKSFVGTPCWMAPEVINGKQYDASADIWSFGITALELTQGRPPRSREKPHSVLLHIVQDAPPTLDRISGVHKYSRAFQDMIASCLNKDPTKRPSAEELLQTHFFKNTKKKSYLVNTILKGLPPLTQRQERRKQPSIITHPTMDSWDFATTIGSTSPTTSDFSHNKARPMTSLPDGSVFEIEDDEGVTADTEGNGGLRKPPRSIDSTSRGDGEDGESASAYAKRITGKHTQFQHHPRPRPALQTHSKRASRTTGDNGEYPSISVHATEEGDVPEITPNSGSATSSPAETSLSPADTLIPPPTATTLLSNASFPMSKEPSSSSSAGGLPVPRRHETSASPAASSYSSMTSSTSASAEPVTPPSNTPSGIWRKLTVWAEDKEKHDRDREKENSGDTVRKKSFGGTLLSRSSASVGAAGAVLVRTVSRQKNGGGSPPNGQYS